MNHGGVETHLLQASHAKEETQLGEASHGFKETHKIGASQFGLETQGSEASHCLTETHPGRATSPPPVPDEPERGGSGVGDDFGKQLAYLAVGGYYDHQKLRLAHMNRIRDLIRKKNEGIPLDKVEAKKDVKKYDKKYRDENLSKTLAQMEAEKRITSDESAHIVKLLRIVEAEHNMEQQYRGIIEAWVGAYPIYIDFLRETKGIGPVLGGGLLATFDIRKAKHISSFWKYAGLHVVDGKAPKRTRGEKLGYSTQARTLCWKVADSFIKQRTTPYRGIYDRTKAEEIARLKDSGEKGWKLHADLRARRKMVKQFLADFWVAWRKSEGLPVSPPYSARFHPGEGTS